MKKYLLIIFCCIAFGKAGAQKIGFETGEAIEDYDKNGFELVNSDSLNIYAFSYDSSRYFLEVYNKETLKRSAHILIPFPSRDSLSYSYENFIVKDDQYNIFFSYYDKLYSNRKLVMIKIYADINKKIVSLVIDSINDAKRKSDGFSVRNFRNEFISFSNKSKRDSDFVNIDHFDFSGQMIKSQYFEIEEKRRQLETAFIDKYCNLYHLLSKGWGEENIKWTVNAYSPESDKVNSIELTALNKHKVFLTSERKFYATDDKIHLLSPYKTSTTATFSSGLYVATFNKTTRSLDAEYFIPFKNQNVEDIDEEIFSLSSCIIVNIIPHDNNQIEILFESRLHTIEKAYGIQVNEQYDVGNIISVKVDSSFNVTEIHNIHKQQRTSRDDFKYTGFITLSSNNQSFYIYNELLDNLEKAPSKMKKMKGSSIDKSVVISTFLDEGKIVRNILFSKNENEKVNAIMPETALISPNKREVYLLKRVDALIYLMRFFIAD